MTAQKRQRLMFVILIASIAFGLVMKPWERRKPAVVVPEPEVPAVEVATVAVTQPVVAIDYVAEWPSRNPFRQPNARVSMQTAGVIEDISFGAPTFALQGIMSVGGEMACVIDGATRSVGGVFAGWRIEKIEAQGVWVSQGGERHYVPLQ